MAETQSSIVAEVEPAKLAELSASADLRQRLLQQALNGRNIVEHANEPRPASLVIESTQDHKFVVLEAENRVTAVAQLGLPFEVQAS